MQQLRILRQQKGKTQRDMADLLDVDRTTYVKYETGVSEPSFANLCKLADFFHVSADVLIDRRSPEDDAGPWIPVLGRVPAGLPLEAVEEVLDYEQISPHMAAGGEHFALRIQGDSMAPRIRDGDIVIVRRQDSAESGDVAIVLVGNQDATCKRIRREPEGLSLIPDNPAYEPWTYSNEELAALPVTILGRVVELRAKF